MSTGYQGQVVGKDPGSNLRTAYGEAVRFQLDASPFAGEWTSMGNALTGNLGSPLRDVSTLAEACVTADANPGGQVEMVYSLNDVIKENLTDAPGVIATFQKLHLRYYRTDGASVISLSLYETPKAGGGYPTLLDSWSQAAEFGTAAPGPWTQYSDPADLGYAMDVESSTYHLYMFIQNTTKADCRVGVILLDFTKIAAE